MTFENIKTGFVVTFYLPEAEVAPETTQKTTQKIIEEIRKELSKEFGFDTPQLAAGRFIANIVDIPHNLERF